MTRYLWAAMAVLCLASGYWVAHTVSENKRLGEAVHQLAGEVQQARELRLVDQAVSKEHAQAIAALRAEKRKADANLTKALAANAPWAAQLVPGDVDSALGL